MRIEQDVARATDVMAARPGERDVRSSRRPRTQVPIKRMQRNVRRASKLVAEMVAAEDKSRNDQSAHEQQRTEESSDAARRDREPKR
jgi:hypothetical protein